MKATILTSCFNCGPWLKPCIRSVMSQGYKDWEWIIVDDKSSDKSMSILKKYAKKCSKIKIMSNKKRLGCGGSYAFALEHATGDVCCVVDADDILSSKLSLGTIMSLYKKYPDVAYIWSQFEFCDPYMKFVKRGMCRVPKISFLQSGLDYSKDRHSFSHWRTFRTELRGKGLIFNPDLPAAVDKWMGYTLEELGVGGFINKVLYLYRQRVGGLSFKGRKHWKKMLKTFDARRKKMKISPYPQIELEGVD